MTIKESRGVVVKIVTLVVESLRQIYDLMMANLFISDDLTLNINPDFYEEPKVVRGKLVIPENSQIDMIDGFHRYLKMCDVKYKNPDWHYNCIFNIMAFNEEKALRYIIQKDKKNHLTEEELVEKDKLSDANYVINRLNENNDFHLRGTLTEEFVFLNKMIVKYFNPDMQTRFKVFETIRDNINLLIETYNLFGKRLSKEEWFVYLYVLKYCTDKNLDFISFIKNIELTKTIEKIKFKKEPTPKHENIVKEVIANVNV
jgi:hypothetical protein